MTTLNKLIQETEFAKKLKTVVEASDFCDQKLYREVYDEYQYHNIAPPHNFETCEICKLAKKINL